MIKKFFAIAIICLAMFVGSGLAATLPNATPETQGISVSTDIVCVGTVLQSSEYSHALTSGNNLLTPHLAANESRSTQAYRQAINANNGKVAISKTFAANTKDATSEQFNVKTETEAAYSGSVMITSEGASVMTMGTGKTLADDVIACPFGPTVAGKTIPASNELVSAGSYGVISSGVVSTDVSTRAITGTDAPSALNYDISVTGIAGSKVPNTGSQAVGFMSTTFTVDAQDARKNGGTNTTTLKDIPNVYNVIYAPAYNLQQNALINQNNVADITDIGAGNDKQVVSQNNFASIKLNMCPSINGGKVTIQVNPTAAKQTVTTTTPVYTPASDITYKDSSFVDGKFTMQKSYTYTSGF